MIGLSIWTICRPWTFSIQLRTSHFLIRVAMDTIAPLADGLVIDVETRLWQESFKTSLDIEFQRRGSGVVCSAGTPQKELVASLLKGPNSRNRGWNRDSFRSNGSNQRIVDINKDHFGMHLTSQFRL